MAAQRILIPLLILATALLALSALVGQPPPAPPPTVAWAEQTDLAPATLECLVLDRSGAPVPNTPVYLRVDTNWETQPVDLDMPSGEDGKCVFAELPPGLYDVSAPQSAGSSGPVLLVPGDVEQARLYVGRDAPAGPHIPQSAGPPMALRTEPQPSPAVVGTVTGTNGRPVRGATVHIDLHPLDPPSRWERVTRLAETDGTGAFAADEVEGGFHIATVVAQGKPVAFWPFYAAPEPDREPVQIGLRRPGSLRGSVINGTTDTALAGAIVALVERRQVAAGDTNGTYELRPDYVAGRLKVHDESYARARRADRDAAEAYEPDDDVPGETGERKELSEDAGYLDLPDAVQATVTGQDGGYRFDDVPPGEYTVICAAAGDWVGDDWRSGRGEVFSGGASEVPPILFQQRNEHGLRVRLLDENGEPLSGVFSAPEVEWGPDEGPTGHGRTDADGLCHTYPKQPGWYALKCSAPGSLESHYWSALVPAVGPMEPVDVRLRPELPVTLRIKAILPTGEPAPADTWLLPIRGHWGLEGEGAAAGDQGVCAIGDLPPGTYRVCAKTPRRADGERDVRYGITPEIECHSGAVHDVTVVLELTCSVSGRVTGSEGEPLDGAVVRAARPGVNRIVGFYSDVSCVTHVDGDGRFALDSLLPGPWDVQATTRRSRRHPGSGAEQGLLSADEQLELAPGQTDTVDLEVRWRTSIGQRGPIGVAPPEPPPDPLIVGRAVWADTGEPAAGAIVGHEGSAKDSWRLEVVAATDGSFALPLSEWARQAIHAIVPGEGRALSSGARAEPPEGADEDGATDGVELRLERNGSLSGTVVAAEGQELLSGLMVKVQLPQYESLDGPYGWEVGAPLWAAVTSDGKFTLPPLAPGEHRVRLELAGMPMAVPLTVPVEPGEATELTLPLAPIEPVVAGTYLDVDGRTPVPYARARLYGSSSQDLGWLHTDADGEFVLHNVPHGAYRASELGYGWARRDALTFEVGPGTREIQLVRSPESCIAGRALSIAGDPLPDHLWVALADTGHLPWLGAEHARVSPDGSYQLRYWSEGTRDLCLMTGAYTVLTREAVTCPERGQVEAPDMLWPGYPRE